MPGRKTQLLLLSSFSIFAFQNCGSFYAVNSNANFASIPGWAVQSGARGPGESEIKDAVSAPDGSVFTVGSAQGEGSFIPDADSASTNQKGFISKVSSSGALLWSREASLGGANVYFEKIYLARSLNLYVLGYTLAASPFTGFDGVRLPSGVQTIVAKYSPTGDLLWIKNLSGEENSATRDQTLCEDSNQELVIAMTGAGTILAKPSIGVNDAIYVKMDSSGTVKWTTHLGVAGVTTQSASVACDSTGQIYAAGSSDGSLDGQPMRSSKVDGYLIKLNSAGQTVWLKEFGASEIALVKGMILKPDGDILVSGGVRGVFPGLTRSPFAARDTFLASFTTTGVQSWVNQYSVEADNAVSTFRVQADGSIAGVSIGNGTSSKLIVQSDGTFVSKANFVLPAFAVTKHLSCDQSQACFLMGSSSKSIDTSLPLASERGYFILYDPTFTSKLTAQINIESPADSETIDMATDSSSNLYLLSRSSGRFDGFDSNPEGCYISKYSPTGARLWSKQMPDVAGQSIAVTEANGVIVGGLIKNPKLCDSATTLTKGVCVYVRTVSADGNLVSEHKSEVVEPFILKDLLVDVGHGYAVTGYRAYRGPKTINAEGDTFVTSYDLDLKVQWTNQVSLSEVGSIILSKLRVTKNHVLVAAGIADSDSVTEQPSVGKSDLILMRFSATGAAQMIKRYNSKAKSEATAYFFAFAIDEKDRLYTATRMTYGGSGYDDLEVTQWSLDGQALWTKLLTAAGGDTDAASILRSNDGITIAGTTTGHFNQPSPKSGARNWFLARLSDSGTVSEISEEGLPGASVHVNAAALSLDKTIYLGGKTNGSYASPQVGRWDTFVRAVYAKPAEPL